MLRCRRRGVVVVGAGIALCQLAACAKGTGTLEKPRDESPPKSTGSAGAAGAEALAEPVPAPHVPDINLDQYADFESLAGPADLAAIDDDEDYEHRTELLYLSGKGFDDPVEWDFMCTGGEAAGKWSTIGVPSNWEQYGFGLYSYGTARYTEEQGHYRREFRVPDGWDEKRIFIVFEGAMTDTEVNINGKSAGPVHQGGFYRFQYEISDLVNSTEQNLLEVTVSKHSSNDSVNEAERNGDYWAFGGIYRPVYLAAVPEQSIERIAVDARADGSLDADVLLRDLQTRGEVVARLFDQKMRPVGEPIHETVDAEQSEVTLSGEFSPIEAWNPESPTRYRLAVELSDDSGQVHAVRENIGFRTIEVREEDGIYLNGTKLLLKGVNRHSFWPNSGRALSPELSLYDVRLIKSMNMNAVRSSHYPPDRHFLEACDREGLLVLDELAGWQDSYDFDIGSELVREMVTFDVNHPSIIFWDNGNEWGWNSRLSSEFSRWDPQQREVLLPGDRAGGLRTPHYQSYEQTADELGNGTVYLTTEFSHAMYDQGGGAALADFWDLFRSEPNGAGGFIWAFVDEGILRADTERIDTTGNSAPDGIVGPYRQKEGSYYTIRQVWSPVQVELQEFPPDFDGTIPLRNRYAFTDLEEVSFAWRLARFDFDGAERQVLATGTQSVESIPPGSEGNLELELPEDWSNADALQLDALDAEGRLIATWSWMVSSASDIAAAIVDTTSPQVAEVEQSQDAEQLLVTAASREFAFSMATGQLLGVQHGDQTYSLANGPALLAGEAELTTLDTSAEGDDVVITATYSGNLEQVQWRAFGNGWLQLTYRYALEGEYDYFGVGFEYPEDDVTGAEWLARGPHRVWKNRMEGPWHDVWQRDYNDAVPGQEWDFPEFKGYYADVRWLRLATTEGPIHLVVATDDLFLGLFVPRDGVNPRESPIVYPGYDISLLHGISPIGTFTLPAADLGPQGQPYSLSGSFEGTVYLYFGDLASG